MYANVYTDVPFHVRQAVPWHTFLLFWSLGSYHIAIKPKTYVLVFQGLPNSLGNGGHGSFQKTGILFWEPL